nr:protein CFAP141 isoform X1 [Anser cygnoides]
MRATGLGCQEPFPAGSKEPTVTTGLSLRCRLGDGNAGLGDVGNGLAGAGGGCGVPTAPAMAAATRQTLSLRREQVLAKESAYAEWLRSWGQAAGEHPQRQERTWATSLGALRWSLAVELCLASKERTTVRSDGPPCTGSSRPSTGSTSGSCSSSGRLSTWSGSERTARQARPGWQQRGIKGVERDGAVPAGFGGSRGAEGRGSAARSLRLGSSSIACGPSVPDPGTRSWPWLCQEMAARPPRACSASP